MPSCEMFSRLDMELERERENELSSLSTRPVGNIHTLGLLPPRSRGAGGERAGRGRGQGGRARAPPAAAAATVYVQVAKHFSKSC